jgi:cytochrome c oxidase subunit IV
MSSDVTHAPLVDEAEASLPAEHHIEHLGPSDRTYVIVALVLGVLTAIETFTYFESVVDFGVVLVPLLLVCMGFKFYLIAAYFMHLRYDRKVLRRIFLTGIFLAVSVYMIMLMAFKLFTDGVPN